MTRGQALATIWMLTFLATLEVLDRIFPQPTLCECLEDAP